MEAALEAVEVAAEPVVVAAEPVVVAAEAVAVTTEAWVVATEAEVVLMEALVMAQAAAIVARKEHTQVTAANEAKTRMVSSLKTEAKGVTAVMKMITAVSTALSLLAMQMGTTHAMRMALTRAITVVLAATVLHKVTAATEAKAMVVGLAASISLLVLILPLMVFVPHPLSCQQ